MPNFNGLWTSRQQMQARGGNVWPATPRAPTSPVATAGNASASVAFVAPADTGYPAGTIIGYRVTSSPGGFTGTGATSPITVTGLTNGTAYTFTVAAQNVNGYGPESVASNSVTPANPNYIEDVFSTYLYTGNGSTQTITNNIDLSTKGGAVWIKGRNQPEPHVLVDTARGASNALRPNSSDASINNAGRVSAFTTSGFTVGTDGETNGSGTTYASWTFREQAKFFDVVTWSGDSTSGRQIAHNLGSTPGMVIIKSLVVDNWCVWHRSLTAGNYIVLNSTAAQTTAGAVNRYGNGTTTVDPTSTYITVGSNGEVNQTGNNYVAYVFAHDAGGFGLTGTDNVISCGSFTADGSGNATVSLGYEPQWVLIKQTNGVDSWYLNDNMRGMAVSGNQPNLSPNSAAAESAGGYNTYPNATGFTASVGIASAVYIYIAIRRGPMAVPTLGTTVYDAKLYTGAGTNPVTISGISMVPDFAQNISRNPSTGQGPIWWDRLRGGTLNLETRSTGAENTQTAATATFDKMTTVTLSGGDVNATSYPFVNHFLKRAPSFFDEVCYTGTGGNSQTFTHNLGVAPELVIVKNRDAAAAWESLGTALSASQRQIYLNRDAAGVAVGVGHLGYNGTDGAYKAPTSTVVYFGGDSDVGGSSVKYVAYLFATCAGVSKVGTYTGTGATQTIACGFAAGARFVVIKRTDSIGDWYVWDTVRGMVSGTDPSLLLNNGAAEVNANSVYTITTGFQIVSTAAGINASGGTYIFLAIA